MTGEISGTETFDGLLLHDPLHPFGYVQFALYPIPAAHTYFYSSRPSCHITDMTTILVLFDL